ncbi:MAG: sulfotransferase [Porticoccaceae bacterium]
MNIYNELRIRTGRLLPRRFHCYCIGAAKTATTSVSSMFKQNFDASHEPEIRQTNHTIIDYLENRIDRTALLAAIEQRDLRLKLEMESTHSLIYIAKELVELFPQAKFIVTVREPMAWLRSRINFHFKKHPPEWEEYRQYFWMDRNTGYAPEETLLLENGLASLDTYLSQYAEHYQLASACLPDERCLFITTRDISNQRKQIADFLNIHEHQINLAHANSEPDKASFIQEINEDFIIRKIWFHCEPLIREFFPERISFYENRLVSRNHSATTQ